MANLAFVKYPPPDEGGWGHFVFHHASHHQAIETGLADKFGVPAVAWQLWPFFEADMERWLRVHQEAHARFCSLLDVPSHDLTGLQLHDRSARDDWLALHFYEHQGAAQRLGTTIT